MKNKGIVIYYTCLIIAAFMIIFFSLYTFNLEGDYTGFRYIIMSYAFGGVVSLGAIFREAFSNNFIKKKLIIKIIVFVLFNIINGVVFIINQDNKIRLYQLFASLIEMVYIFYPTVGKDQNEK